MLIRDMVTFLSKNTYLQARPVVQRQTLFEYRSSLPPDKAPDGARAARRAKTRGSPNSNKYSICHLLRLYTVNIQADPKSRQINTYRLFRLRLLCGKRSYWESHVPRHTRGNDAAQGKVSKPWAALAINHPFYYRNSHRIWRQQDFAYRNWYKNLPRQRPALPQLVAGVRLALLQPGARLAAVLRVAACQVA